MTQHVSSQWSRRTSASLLGLALGVVGILLQYVGDTSLFGGTFPPGIYFLVGAGLLVVLARRWAWAPIFAVLMAAWVTFGGIVGGQLGDNIASGNGLVMSGAVVLQLGLALSIIAGIAAIVRNNGIIVE